MTIFDDGDVIRGVGFVAVYNAYLEDNIAELIEITTQITSLKKNIQKLSLSDQAKHLSKALAKLFKETHDWNGKEEDQAQTKQVLKNVEKITVERNKTIHSVLISNQAGVVTQKNRRLNIESKINSTDVYDLANYIFELQSQVKAIRFAIQRLSNHLN
ncbi:hypothetical protein [Legionella worsleiensis]|uniref:hypothetical protein n=1 Tax=Legionella worsleiensis TaxID=45076 RepID=UPI000DFEF018|nr:hypothetical protein [Legionella worsleiensis]STY50001.1 Uncharacterised protein [Legionella worsleiensis]